MPIPFSILDLAHVPEGKTPADSFASSVALAQKAEATGYNRVWYAEHHGMAGVASSATSVLIGHVANHTKTIRLGSGGIMLPNHAPLLVAEQFGTLATLHPGRIDLGLGRAPGGDQTVMRAMRKDLHRAANEFPADVQELLGYLATPASDDERMAVRAVPGEGTEVPVWILGSSLFGAQLAAQLGLPYAFASHFAPAELMRAAEIYRRQFKPSKYLDKPYFMMAANVFAADTDEDANYHFTSLIQAFTRMITGQRGQLPPPVEQLEVHPAVGQQLEGMLQISAVGTVETVADRLRLICAKVEPDEVIIAKSFFDQGARLRSVELTANVQERMSARLDAA